MQTAQSEIHSGTANPSQFAQSAGGTAVASGTALGVNLADYKIIRRNGAVVSFEPSKIAVAMTKAFLAVNGGQGAASARVRELVDQQTQNVVRALLRSRPNGGTFHIEDVQDQVELALMRSGEHDVARAYVLYRERRAQERAQAGETQQQPAFIGLNVTDGGITRPLDMAALRNVIVSACEGLGEAVDPEPILKETVKNLYEGVPMTQVYDSAILASRTLIEKDPAYSQVTARILMHTIRREILGEEVTQTEMSARYVDYFPQFIKRGINAELLDDKLAQFDLARLGAALDASRDFQFNYLGLQTLYDRYFLHINETRIEMPQAFFMRVAMGLALNEIDREARAIEFYQLLSSFDFMSSTPTLFNSGTRRSQLSSCYLTTVSDDLDGIRRRPGQRLDQCACPGLAHQGHERQVARRGAVPEGRQRHGCGREPRRQAQGRRLRVPGNVAPGYRRIPGAAQEHRRRPPPHARHEHGQLDSGPVHEARDGRWRVDAVLAVHLPGPA